MSEQENENNTFIWLASTLQLPSSQTHSAISTSDFPDSWFSQSCTYLDSSGEPSRYSEGSAIAAMQNSECYSSSKSDGRLLEIQDFAIITLIVCIIHSGCARSQTGGSYNGVLWTANWQAPARKVSCYLIILTSSDLTAWTTVISWTLPEVQRYALLHNITHLIVKITPQW